MIKNTWDNVLSCCEVISEDIKANASKISLIQQILQHFWSANNKLTTIESRKESNLHITTTTSCLTSANVHDINVFRVSKQVSEPGLLRFLSHIF